MSHKAAGIDISDRSIELVAFRARGGGVIDGVVRTELPAGIVSRGEIQDYDALLKQVKALFQSLFGSGSDKITVGAALPEAAVYTKIFRLPVGLDERQYHQALEIAASDEFPFDLNADMVSASINIETVRGGRFYLYSTTQLQLASDYERLLREAGTEPMFLEPESVALARATVEEQEEAVDVLLADIGARTTMLVALGRRSQPIISAAVPVGGDILSTAIESSLKVSLEEAEKLKRKAGFNPKVDDGRVMMIIQRPFDEIANEIKSTIDYYKRRTSRDIGKILLVGGTSLLPGIVDYVSSRFAGLKVEAVNPTKRVKVSSSAQLPPKFKQEAVLYSTAIGLAMRAAGTRDRPGPNLLPSIASGAKKRRSLLQTIRSIFKKVPSSYASK